VYLRDRATQRSPPPLVCGKGNRLLSFPHQVRAEDRTHSRCYTGSLEVDGAVDSVGIGAGQRSKAPLCGRVRESFGTGNAESEGKVGVNVEVGEGHLKRER
jgi:hypothetical protein